MVSGSRKIFFAVVLVGLGCGCAETPGTQPIVPATSPAADAVAPPAADGAAPSAEAGASDPNSLHR